MPSCNCIELTDALLKERFNARLDLTISWSEGWARPTIGTHLIAKQRGKKPPNIVASHCPWCGEKYEADAARAAGSGGGG